MKKGVGKTAILANMDEIPCYYDMRRHYTYHWKGARTVKLIKNNGDKKRITVCLAVLSNGEKLAPLIIFKGKTPPANPLSKHVHVANNENAWVTEAMMQKWTDDVWHKAHIPEEKHKILILDKCSAHQKESVKKGLEKREKDVRGQKTAIEDCSVRYIPGGCTSLLQPLDLVINKPFKEKMKMFYNEWLKTEGLSRNNITPKGYIKAPSAAILIRWVHQAWESIPKELVIKAFKTAGMVNFFWKKITSFKDSQMTLMDLKTI